MPSKDINRDEVIPLSERENDVFEQLGEVYGISVDEAFNKAASEGLARLIKRKTGESPARIYGFKPKK